MKKLISPQIKELVNMVSDQRKLKMVAYWLEEEQEIRNANSLCLRL